MILADELPKPPGLIAVTIRLILQGWIQAAAGIQFAFKWRMSVGQSRMKKGNKMFFIDLTSREIDRYGVGMTTGKGRYHFMASIGHEKRVRQLCMSKQKDLNGLSGKVKWFDSESRAVKAFRKNKKACHKCLRAIETIELKMSEVE